MERQFTLSKPTSMLHGTGLHTGKASSVRLWPAPAGAGLVFRRADMPGFPDIPASVESVESTVRCVALARGGARVSTVEHILAACMMAGLDNAVISVEGDELPGADGSALPFLEMLESAELSEQDAPRRFIVPTGRVETGDAGHRIFSEPSGNPEIRFRFRGAPGYDGREAVFGPNGAVPRDVASARSFCYEDEVPALRAQGLGKGGNLDNVLVLRRDGTTVNEARGKDEPILHKLLDLVGDLALAGAPVRGRIMAEGTGHAGHVEFVRALLGAVNKKEAGKRDA